MHSRSRFSKTLSITFTLVVVLATSVLLFGLIQQKDTANAISARDFNAGRIIDDGVFYNKNAMTVQQIQAFIGQLMPNCDTWGTQPSGYGNLTNAQYAQQVQGWPGPPYVCLKDYHENPTTGETSFEKGGGAFAGGMAASQIIYNAAQTYSINPQVLLVFLKKESVALTSDTWPMKSQYKYAMGYACPDSGPNYSANCDAAKAGFYKQVMLAAWQLNYYREHPNDYRYGLGWNDIQYSTNPSCGTKRVYVENMATLSLYIYTPYTPNDSALASYPGTAPCGAYGNRNFFMYFSEWFGSTHGNRWVSLKDPRVLVTAKPTYKINPDTGEQLQSVPAGLQIAFPTKTTLINASGCLRTRLDTANNANQCIKYEDLDEFTPTITSINTDGSVATKQTAKWTCKVNYRTLEATNQCFDPLTQIDFLKKTTVAGVDYLITKVDTNSGNPTAFLASRIIDIPPDSPASPLPANEKKQKSLTWTCKIDLSTKTIVSSQCYDKNTVINFSKTSTIDGVKYLITTYDDTRAINTAFLAKRFTIVE